MSVPSVPQSPPPGEQLPHAHSRQYHLPRVFLLVVALVVIGVGIPVAWVLSSLNIISSIVASILSILFGY